MGNVGTVWKIHTLIEAGLSVSQPSLDLYVRAESVQLWNMLNRKFRKSLKESTVFKLQGPPGIGKSTELFGWLMWISTRLPGLNITWIHRFRNDDNFKVIERSNGIWTKVSSTTLDNVNFEGKQIVVLDAMGSEIFLTMKFAIKSSVPLIVICNSYSVTANSEVSVLLGLPAPYVMASVTFDDYVNAIKVGIQICDVNDNPDMVVLQENGELSTACMKALIAKYHYGGWSFRLMQTKLTNLIALLNNAIEQVTDKGLLLKGLQSSNSLVAVHTLMALNRENMNSSILVSEYVAKKLSMTVDFGFISKAKMIMINNPSWERWVFVLETIWKFRTSKSSITLQESTDGNNHVFAISGCTPYEETSFKLVANTVYIPTKWNNECYDFVHYRYQESDDKPHQFTFFNATIAQTHSFDFFYLNEFLSHAVNVPDGYKVSHHDIKINFFVVVPSRNHSCTCSVENAENTHIFDSSFQGSFVTAAVMDTADECMGIGKLRI